MLIIWVKYIIMKNKEIHVMRKKHANNFIGIICLVAIVYVTFEVLLQDDILPFSICSVQTSMNHWIKDWHIVAVGLLPIYVALVFFGAVFCGLFFGSAAQRWISRFLQQK